MRKSGGWWLVAGGWWKGGPFVLRYGVVAGFMLLAIFGTQAPAVAAETVCVQCHGGQPGKGGKPVPLWRGSIHAGNGISCHDCHGGDPQDAANAMSPARGFLGVPKEVDVPAFCGRCHVGIKDDFLKSAHGRALGKGGPVCTTCHGSHDVRKVTLELINEQVCSRCHPFERAARIKEAMRRTESRLVDIEGQLIKHKGQGFDTETGEKALFNLRNRYHRLFHEVDTTRVQGESTAMAGELDKLQQNLDRYADQLYRRKLAGAFVVGACLLAALLFYLLRKTYD